jgi:hypothetical protein
MASIEVKGYPLRNLRHGVVRAFGPRETGRSTGVPSILRPQTVLQIPRAAFNEMR